MALQIDIEWPETGNKAGKSFTASGTVWEDSEMVAARAVPMANVQCTLTGTGGTYNGSVSIPLPAAGGQVAWAVPLPGGAGQIAVGTYSLKAVLQSGANPSDQEDEIQVETGGPPHGEVIFTFIEE